MKSARWLVMVLLALSLLAGFMTGATLYYRLSYLWIILLISSWIMSVLALRGIRITRTARSLRAQVGQIYEERFEIVNPHWIPRLWVEVHDESTLPGSRGSHVLTLIGKRETRSYLSRTWLIERGVFPLGPTKLFSGDLFGLFPVQRVIPSQQQLLVYPMIVDVRSFPNPPGLLPGGEALRRRTPQITSNASGVREYAPGDPLNRIHWISTARRNRLMVKEFELDPLAEVWIFIDTAKTIHTSKLHQKQEFNPNEIWKRPPKFELPPSTLEYAITAAASLARYYIQRSRAVGMAYAGHSLRILPADRGGRQLGKILEALALLRAETDYPLHGLVEAQARHLPRGSTLVIITPSTSETIFRTGDLLLRRGFRPVMVLLNSITFNGYFSPEKLTASLRFMGIPVCEIACGDDLGAALSGVVSYQVWN